MLRLQSPNVRTGGRHAASLSSRRRNAPHHEREFLGFGVARGKCPLLLHFWKEQPQHNQQPHGALSAQPRRPPDVRRRPVFQRRRLAPRNPGGTIPRLFMFNGFRMRIEHTFRSAESPTSFLGDGASRRNHHQSRRARRRRPVPEHPAASCSTSRPARRSVTKAPRER